MKRGLNVIVVTLGCLFASIAYGKVVVEGTRVVATTATAVATFDGPALVSFKPAGADVEFVHKAVPACAVDVIFVNGETVGKDKHETVTVHSLSDRAATVTVKGDDSQRVLLITTDDQSNDICITPSSVTTRRAVTCVRWTIGLCPEASLILPAVNGMRVDVDRPWPPTNRFHWPRDWNAQLVIAERDDFSCMVHCQDTSMAFKTLDFRRQGDRRELGFETEIPGPIWNERAAGGITWRLNMYRGDWKIPATRYRDWMAKTYDLAAKRVGRPAWVQRINLAVCWAAPIPEVLDALAAVHPPDETLIHLASWRTDGYDINYPEYTPNPKAIAYMKKARQMGFHVAPHFNYFCVYNKHPFFQVVRDYQVRDLRSNKPQGWYWPPETHDHTRMSFIHPGFSIWRRKFMETLLATCDQLETDVAFTDQTLCTWNVDNSDVEGMNMNAGLRQMHEEFAAVRPDLVLVGEGLNELSFQRQCFAQGHIIKGRDKVEQEKVDAAHPICSFLWGDHCKLIGYLKLNPSNPDFDAVVALYERMGAIPTIIANDPKQIREMPPGLKRIFDAAKKLRATRSPASTPATQN